MSDATNRPFGVTQKQSSESTSASIVVSPNVAPASRVFVFAAVHRRTCSCTKCGSSASAIDISASKCVPTIAFASSSSARAIASSSSRRPRGTATSTDFASANVVASASSTSHFACANDRHCARLAIGARASRPRPRRRRRVSSRRALQGAQPTAQSIESFNHDDARAVRRGRAFRRRACDATRRDAIGRADDADARDETAANRWNSEDGY